MNQFDETHNEALQQHALDELHRVAELYAQAYGEDGLNTMAEQLCRIVAYHVAGSDGWTNLAIHIQKISG